MKRLFASSIAVALSMGVSISAFAYSLPDGYVRSSWREVQGVIDSSVDVRNVQDTDRVSLPEQVGSDLQRAKMDRNLRNKNRAFKRVGRYRILNRIGADAPKNARTLRKEADTSLLPASLVQTGGSYGYDRPTRRDIRDNAYYSQVTNRDRDILKEIRENQR